MCNRYKLYNSNAHKITRLELFLVEIRLAEVPASHFDEFTRPPSKLQTAARKTALDGLMMMSYLGCHRKMSITKI